MERHFKEWRKRRMNLFGWWKRKKTGKKVNPQSNKEVRDICPECSGQGYSINDNYYFTDGDDYERRYSSCRKCNGTGRYHTNTDDY